MLSTIPVIGIVFHFAAKAVCLALTAPPETVVKVLKGVSTLILGPC